MHTDCAFCTADVAAINMPPPSDWTDYLTAEHDLPPATWSYRIPLCRDCGTDITELKQDYQQRTHLDADDAERIEHASRTILDRLDHSLVFDASPMS